MGTKSRHVPPAVPQGPVGDPHFNPHREPVKRPCWHCRYFDGMASVQGDAAYCSNPECSRVRSQASRGCVSFEREMGADDA